jgi:uncharacterized protein (TIGR03067 family)
MCLACRVVVGLAVLASSASAGAKPAAADGDPQRIVGTWKVVSQNGRGVPGDTPPPPVRITADTFTVMHEKKGDRLGFRYTIDPKQEPPHFDAYPEEDPGKPLHQKGIYKLEGDTLTIALASAGRERPTSFEGGASDAHVMVLKRAAQQGQ